MKVNKVTNISTNKPKFIREKEFYTMLLKIALPITMQNIILFLVQMMDTVMLGELGDVAMSASSLANQPFFLFNMLTFGIAGGASVLTAQYWGKGEIAPIKLIITTIIKIAMTAGLILNIIVFVFPRQVMGIFTPDPEVISAGADYLRILGFSLMFFGFINIFYSVIRSVEIVKVAVISSIIGLVTNVVLNYILIFGKFGAPALGVKGAAIATLIARILEFTVAIVYMFFIDKKLKIRLKDFLKTDKLLFSDLVSISTPVILNETMWGLGISMQAGLLGQLGTTVVAANSIINIIQQLSTVAVFGIANAAAVMIGKAIGEGDMQKARDRGHTFMILSIIFGVFVSILIILARNIAIDFYNVSPEAKALAHEMVYVAAAIGFFVSISATGVVGILRGGGDTKFSLAAEMLALWVVAVPLAYFSAFVLHLPVVAVYMIMKIDEPLKVVLLLIRMRGSKWLKDVTRDNIMIEE